jgi:hypothetical protein
MIQRMNREELDQKMDDSERALENGWLDFADRLEDEIESTMERMATQMRELENELPQTDEEQLRRALADIQSLRERLEEMQQQAAGQSGESQPGESQPGESQQGQSQSGQPQSGQPQSGQSQSGQSGNRNGRAQQARMERQMEQAREAMERLEQQLSGNEGLQRQLQQARNVMRNLNDASNTGILLDEEAAKSLFNKDVYKPLSELETELARQLDVIEMEKKLFGARNAQVPDEYREAVDRYYESLSKSKE